MTAADLVIVDCSLVVDALTMRELGAARKALAARRMYAPALLDYEVVSALRGLALGGRLSLPRARDALGDYADLAIVKTPLTRAQRDHVWALRDRLTAYDAAYVALADAIAAPLWTRDARLGRSCPPEVDVHLW